MVCVSEEAEGKGDRILADWMPDFNLLKDSPSSSSAMLTRPKKAGYIHDQRDIQTRLPPFYIVPPQYYIGKNCFILPCSPAYSSGYPGALRPGFAFPQFRHPARY